MGTKNRIKLGIITSLILHNFRNIFSNSKDIYITKRKYNIVKTKHPDIVQYIDNKEFQTVLNNTVASCLYKRDDKIYNFISKLNDRYILYGISNNDYYIHITTVFYASKKRLLYCEDSIKFFKDSFKDDFYKYLAK